MQADTAAEVSAAERFRLEAKILKALAHEARLTIVDRLSRGECCVCELVKLVGTDQSTVSRHLGRLRAAGIVEGSRRGKHVIYRLLAPCVLAFLSCATEVAQNHEAGARDS